MVETLRPPGDGVAATESSVETGGRLVCETLNLYRAIRRPDGQLFSSATRSNRTDAGRREPEARRCSDHASARRFTSRQHFVPGRQTCHLGLVALRERASRIGPRGLAFRAVPAAACRAYPRHLCPDFP